MRVTVGCSDLFDSIYCFAWSKIYSKFFVRDFFCWLFTCVYFINWINVHWSWNLSLVVLENCQWAISKPDICIFSPHRFVEGCGEGDSFWYFAYRHQYIYWLKFNHYILFMLIVVGISFRILRRRTQRTLQIICLWTSQKKISLKLCI